MNVGTARRGDGSWNIQTIYSGVGTGVYSVSLALDVNDQPHIAYYDFTNRRVRSAVCVGDHWDLQTVDTSIL